MLSLSEPMEEIAGALHDVGEDGGVSLEQLWLATHARCRKSWTP